MRTSLVRDLWPRIISTPLLAIRSLFASSEMTASLALPLSGGAVTRTVTSPSPETSMALRFAFGWTLISSSMFSASHCPIRERLIHASTGLS